ncbi:MAG: hypothetical protein ABR910_08515 [Acidobacteriaceae bacterium]|jgi:hypothetical protein
MSERANPFADLKIPATFATKPKADKAAEEQTVARIADDNNFTSREPAKTPKAPKRKPRIHRTGRNQQFTAKATAETVSKIYQLADARKVPLGELLRLAVEALERDDAVKQANPASE